MNSNQIREIFLQYFESKGYVRTPSASLIPAGDQTLLFTNAGMVPFKEFFLNIKKPPNVKVCTSQKCIRAGGKHNDLDQVGLTARHHTFFEMLGNFIFKDANKQKAIEEAWELLTEKYQIPKERLWVTVFHEDKESRAIWEKHIGLTPDRVIDCGEEDNFWSMGDVGPCGPCTEIFYDHGEGIEGGLPGTAEQDGDRFTEIWNLVFMQYEMLADGSRVELDSMGLDTGMGLERLSAVLQSVHNNFDTDIFMQIISTLQKYPAQPDLVTSRVIADHIRASVFLIIDQVNPSNEGRGYVLRRIIRRAISFGYRSGIKTHFFYQLAPIVEQVMGSAYPELKQEINRVQQTLKDEEVRFQATLEHGMKLLQGRIDAKEHISGETAFILYDTYGFPFDLTKDVAEKYDLKVDEEGYHKEMSLQKARSRDNASFALSHGTDIKLKHSSEFIGYHDNDTKNTVIEIMVDGAISTSIQAEQEGVIVTEKTTFYPEGGGQVGDTGTIETDTGSFIVQDTKKVGSAIAHFGYMQSGALSLDDEVILSVDSKRRSTMNNHSATHLLHAALRHILGEHVIQKGSLVNHERLRFDFTHKQPLTHEELTRVESLVNEHIRHNHQQDSKWLPLAEAKEMKIMALFDEKYEDPVRVIRFGEFSAELCGGTHVNATGEIGVLKIIQETGIASGVRRIEAITGAEAITWIQNESHQKQALAKALKTDIDSLLPKAKNLMTSLKQMQKHGDDLEKKLYMIEVPKWLDEAENLQHGQIVIQYFTDLSTKTLKLLLDSIKSRFKEGVIILINRQSDTSTVIVGQLGGHYHAGDILQALIKHFGGKGGGKADLAQGVIDQGSALSADKKQIIKMVTGILS